MSGTDPGFPILINLQLGDYEALKEYRDIEDCRSFDEAVLKLLGEAGERVMRKAGMNENQRLKKDKKK